MFLQSTAAWIRNHIHNPRKSAWIIQNLNLKSNPHAAENKCQKSSKIHSQTQEVDPWLLGACVGLTIFGNMIRSVEITRADRLVAKNLNGGAGLFRHFPLSLLKYWFKMAGFMANQFEMLIVVRFIGNNRPGAQRWSTSAASPKPSEFTK